MTIAYSDAFTGSNGAAAANLVVSNAGTGTGSCVIQGNKLRMTTSGSAGHVIRAILPSAQWQSAEGRATITWTTPASGPGNIVPQIQLRTSGNWDTEIDSPVLGYKCIFLQGSGVGLFKRTGGTTTQLGSYVSKTITTSTTYGFTLETTGTTIRCRMWTGSSDPGGSWDISVTDSAVAGPGQFQMALLSQDAAVLSVDWDDLSLDNLLTSATGPRPRLMRV